MRLEACRQAACFFRGDSFGLMLVATMFFWCCLRARITNRATAMIIVGIAIAKMVVVSMIDSPLLIKVNEV
jgi:hypothetical protein